ncbi:hypothetical protein BTUL_0035g00140 [Botrytis tulipae]|uniref:RRM domain-containing protein n=1 Tax=Botrytis tulipae TaxID=87230 RepID=A0A4Z1F2S7_9HELO|nr:hypothetical protein BTUL_0035g00140 [Botrytis tulipae]
MNSETLVERGSEEILSTNQPSNNINNAWRRSLAGGKAVNLKFFEPQNFPSNEPITHRQSEGDESREGHSCSPQENRHNYSQTPFQAVFRSPKSPIVQSSLPENHPGVSQSLLQAVTASSLVQSKSSPENSPSTSQSPTHANTAVPIVQHNQAASPDYADPRRVPGTDQNIYPRAPIKSEFQQRYPQLVDFFKQAVDTHKFLKYHTSKINYELRLCGSTPANAVASVIIFCAEALFKCLRSLLGSRHICRQYQLINSSFRDRFQLTPSKPHPQVSAPTVVPFNVVYWREANTPTKRNSAMEQVVARNHSFLTMCGSLVKYGDRTSTLGLLISMDSKLYGLTVDHLFKNQQGEEQPTIANEAEVLYDEDDSEDSEPEWAWIDDVKYEDFENAECVSDAESVSSGGSHTKITIDRGPNEDYGESINGHKADIMFTTDTTMAYLDWALIEFDDGYYERPNAFFSEDDLANPKFFGILSAAPKTSEVKVFMISGVSGTKKGVMLAGISYIGGKPSEDLCQAWNLILSDSSRVIDGDCGSLIVDQETLEVYGHVVASNPLGEAYVVPLQNTFRQISSAFGAQDLFLPNPVLLMESIVAHYSQKDNSGVADKAKQILASINDPVSESSPGSLGGLNLRLLSKLAVTFGAQTKIEQSNPSSREYNKSPFSPQPTIGNHPDDITLTVRGLLDENLQGIQDNQRHNFPPINPLGQNPPFNTLIVENIPRDTSQDELTAIFSERRGFERLSFRTKQNLPICFVEFVDVSSATKCIQDVNGMSFQDSTKGKIQLSFSKSPLRMLSGRFQPAEEVVPFRGSRNGGHRKSNVTSWSGWEWSEYRKQWQSYRTDSRGGIEWKFEAGPSTSTSSVASNIVRYDDTLPLSTVSENKTQYSVDQDEKYIRDNKNVKALTDSPIATSLVPVANTDLLIAANLTRNNTSTQHKNFDSNYRVHSAREFKFGKFFGLDQRATQVEELPIMSYEGRATSKLGVNADEHAIIYTTPQPRLVQNEDGTKMKYHPIKMIPDSSRHQLDAASRINYHKIYTVEYNVKVWFIGRIDPDSQRAVKESFDQAHPPLIQSTQIFGPNSYPASNSAYSSSPYTMPDNSNTIPPSAPNYEGTGYYTGSSSFRQHGGYSGTEQPESTQYPPTQYPPSQYLPDSTVNTTVHSSAKSRKF